MKTVDGVWEMSTSREDLDKGQEGRMMAGKRRGRALETELEDESLCRG